MLDNDGNLRVTETNKELRKNFGSYLGLFDGQYDTPCEKSFLSEPYGMSSENFPRMFSRRLISSIKNYLNDFRDPRSRNWKNSFKKPKSWQRKFEMQLTFKINSNHKRI